LKVLVIDEWIPWPLESGKKIRTFNLLSRLARTNEITLVAYATLPEEKGKIEAMEKHGIRVVPVEDVRLKKWGLRFYLDVFLNCFSRVPYSTQYHVKKVFTETMRQAIERHKPDLVHCEWTNLAPLLEHVGDIPKVITAHNVESLIWRRLAKSTSNPLKRLVARQQAERIELLERRWYPAVDLTIAVSKEESQVINGYRANVSVVENGVDVRFYEGFGGVREEGGIVFAASFDTFANQDAVDYLFQDILPLIRNKMPDMKVQLVGKDPTKKMRSYARNDPNVIVTGFVPDVRPYIARASVCLVPLRIGGGSRLKILEAMAMRKPVVSTAVGAEGLEVTDGKDILLADESQGLVSKVFRLMERPKERVEIAEAGWRLVREKYDWDTLAEKQQMIWTAVGMRKGEDR